MSGRFIVLEGGEGAGKSAVQRALAERLHGEGFTVTQTREPGGTGLGERVREILLGDRAIDDPLAELLLFEAARAHLVRTVIRPALDRGEWVLCDRFAPSSVAYQGYGRGLAPALVERANEIATNGVLPDIVLLLDVPVEQGLRRRAGEGHANHFDREDVAFHRRVREGYLELAHQDRERWRVIDASQPLEHVVDASYRAVIERHA